jgi:UMF1 family MFS transporter
MSHRARASGIGQFSNSLGQVMGLVMAIPLSHTRLQPLFPSIIIFFILSLPMLLYFKEQKKKEVALTFTEFKNDSKDLYKKFILFFSVSVAIPILVSFFFFNDALITISNNYSIYLERVFFIPDGIKNIILMVVLLMSAFGGLAFGKIADKIGTLKALKYILISWIILLPTLGLVKSLLPLILCSALLGFFMGGIWTVTRAYLSQTLKKEELGYGFSFYTIFERFATFVGPLTWGGIIAVMGTGATSYRTAMISMTVYIILGLVVVSCWRRKENYLVT